VHVVEWRTTSAGSHCAMLMELGHWQAAAATADSMPTKWPLWCRAHHSLPGITTVRTYDSCWCLWRCPSPHPAERILH
jgi:hypothetical protein